MRTVSPLGGLQNKPPSPIARRANNGWRCLSSIVGGAASVAFGHQAVQASLKLLKRRASSRADLGAARAPSAVEARAVAVGAGAAVVEARAGGVGAGAAAAARPV